MKVIRAVAALTALLFVGFASACGGSSSEQSGSSANQTPPPVPTCEGVHAGDPGVVGTFCNGTASAHVTVGTVDKTLHGGTCTTSGGLFVMNVGVSTIHTFQGPRPDFVSVNSPPQGGGGQDTGATVILDGKFLGDDGRFGGTVTFAPDHKSLTFKGSATNGEQATIQVTC